MRSKPAAILIAAFALLALALAEVLYPMRESVKVDIVSETAEVLAGRSRLVRLDGQLDSVQGLLRSYRDSVGRVGLQPSTASEDSLYLVVDTHTNQLFVRRGSALLRTCPAATGSNRALSGGGQRWFFATPRGQMTVRDKRVDPVWIKPDWAFIEVGDVPPPAGSSERFVRGHLGEYALILGGGIMIHGTTDLRSLGRNASHGCIRLGREDLRYVYQATEIGTKVYIF